MPALLLGSHIDTVRNAGKFDGNLGVIAAISAVASLHRRFQRLPFAIEVLAFGDEEGVRFPVTLNGSRAVAGTFDPAALEARDADGITLREALEQFGCDPAGIADVARRTTDVLGYVEVHIEQGPVLEAEDLPVGIVTAINGASRFTIEVTGVAGHAGTVPMHLRQDALAAAAEMVLAVERAAPGHPRHRGDGREAGSAARRRQRDPLGRQAVARPPQLERQLAHRDRSPGSISSSTRSRSGAASASNSPPATTNPPPPALHGWSIRWQHPWSAPASAPCACRAEPAMTVSR